MLAMRVNAHETHHTNIAAMVESKGELRRGLRTEVMRETRKSRVGEVRLRNVGWKPGATGFVWWHLASSPWRRLVTPRRGEGDDRYFP